MNSGSNTLKTMCGISGFSLKRSEGIDYNRFFSISLTNQRDRGPDGDGSWLSPDNAIGFSHTRLAIVDLSSRGSQPMRTEDGRYAITFNGEVYNWREVRFKLESFGISFQSESDTEVILRGYIHYGEKILSMLDGMFAFCVWDGHKDEIFCARDCVGKKPFYYSVGKKGFFFASQLKTLVDSTAISGISRRINKSAIATMLLHNIRHIPEPMTAYEDIYKLRPGHALTVSRGSVIRHWRYWYPEIRPTHSVESLNELIKDSIWRRAQAEVPIAALLSGGIDSTAIVSIASKVSQEAMRTYSFGLSPEDEDIQRARRVAREFKTVHSEIFLCPEDVLEDLKTIQRTAGEPLMLLPLAYSYQISKKIADDGIKVVLNGNGADELFFGYTGHVRTARLTFLLNLLGPLREVLPHHRLRLSGALGCSPGERKAYYYEQVSKSVWQRCFEPEISRSLTNYISPEMRDLCTVVPCNDLIDEVNYIGLFIENAHSLAIASDLPGMMASLEMRSPFLDHRLISAAMSFHYTSKVTRRLARVSLKDVFKRALIDCVPSDVLHASKRGFGMSIQEKDLLLGPWHHHLKEAFADFNTLGMFDGAKVSGLWRSAVNGEIEDWSLISRLFAIHLWAESL